MQKKIIVAAIAAALAFPAVAMADSATDLVNVLIKKGVLTREEGDLLIKSRTGEKEVVAEKKKGDEVITSFKDGISWESADKEFKMSLNGRVQADYRQFSSPATTKSNTFDIRRGYLGVKGKFYKNIEFETTADFAKSTTVMTDYWVNLNYWEQVQLKFGQFKMPMGMEELGSSRFINFQERSMAMSLVPSFDRGIQLHGIPSKGITYALAISNGNMTNTGLQNTTEPTGGSAANDGKDVTGRFTVNIANQMDNMSDAVIHVGGAFSRGTQDGNATLLTMATEARGGTFFSTKAGGYTAGNKVKVGRNAFELGLATGPVKFTSEYVKASFDNNAAAVGAGVAAGNRDLKSWYAAINWNITGESYAPTYAGGKFGSRLKPNQNFTGSGSGLGAWEVGMRYSKFDASNFAVADLLVATATNVMATTADATTLGLKWIVNPHTRFLANYVKTNFKNAAGTALVGGSSNEKAVTFRGQVDF